MEFKIEKEKIIGGLSKVQGITGKKTNIPITSNVVISAKESQVTLLVTDLGIAFEGSYEAEVLSEGSTAVPSRKLYEIVRDFPGKNLSVKETENKWIDITGDKVKYHIVGVDTEEFPALPKVEGVDLFNIDLSVFRGMVEKTIFAVVAEEGRAHLAGVYFEKISEGENKKLRMVSTDGHRLCRIDHIIEDDQDLMLEEGVIIPKSGMVEILRLLEGGNGTQIGFKDNNFIVKKEKEGIIIRLIDGEFPDYNLVIPKKTPNELRVDRQAFLMMMKRMSILSSDKYKGVGLKIEGDQMETTTTNPEIGESREVIRVNYSGEKVELGFNPRYLIDTLSNMESTEVVMKFNDEINPCTVEGKDDTGFLSVIMPMRV